MSQSKVDKKKYEKKHRQEILKKQKCRKLAAKIAAIVVVVGIVGSVAGVKIYKAIPKYVEASELSNFVKETWEDNGYDTLFTATATDASEDTDSEDTENTDDEAETSSEDTETSEE